MTEISKIGDPPPELYGLGISYVGAYAAVWGAKETKKRINEIQSAVYEDIVSTCSVKLTPQQFGKLKKSDAWRDFRNDGKISIYDALAAPLPPAGIFVLSVGLAILTGQTHIRKEDKIKIWLGLWSTDAAIIGGCVPLILFHITTVRLSWE